MRWSGSGAALAAVSRCALPAGAPSGCARRTNPRAVSQALPIYSPVLCPGGLLEGVLGLVRESGWGVEGLEAGFMVGAPEGSAQGERALIGRGRAREVVVNIVLPFAYAWAEANQQSELAEQALALYRGYPPSGGNEITRGLTKLLGDGSAALVNSARRQQGLIHLDKTYCRERKCGECPLARRLAVLQQVAC